MHRSVSESDTAAAPVKLGFEPGQVRTLRVHALSGAVNVVGTEGPARLEISDVRGAPIDVEQDGSELYIGYRDLNWKGWRKWLDLNRWHRRAVISLAVPTGAVVEVGVANADTMVTGLSGAVTVRSVSGVTTLADLTGTVRSENVSGTVDAQAISGTLRVSSVSGEITVADASGPDVTADSVSGGMILDLASSRASTVRLNTVSGEVTVRLPYEGDADVSANSTGGRISSEFDELRLQGTWGASRLSGRLGRGTGKLRVTTISGSVTVLRRSQDGSGDTTTPSETGKVL